MKRISFTIILLILSLASFLIGFTTWYDSLPPTIDEAFPAREIVIGVDATFPPFAVDNGESLYGIDIDLGNTIADKLGLPARFVNMGFDGLYDSLTDGQVDVVISALLVNPTRTQDVRYTIPYFDNGLKLVSNDSDIEDMSDVPSQSLSLEYGSTAHSEANFALQRLAPFNILAYELPEYALDAIRLNTADAALVDATTYLLYQNQYSDFVSYSSRMTNAPYAIAIRYDREATWIWVNETLEDIIKDGTMQAIIDQWFETLSID